jgi:ADP-heptose:LPS heptosyltransferase
VTRLLCIRLGAMGDLLHASASLALLPAEVEVHWLTSPMYVPLISRLPRVGLAIPWDKSTGWPGYCHLIQQLGHYDAVINWHPSLKTWWLARQVSRGPVFTYQKQKLPVAGQAVRVMARRHAVDDFAQPIYQWIGATGQYVKPMPLVPRLTSPEPVPVAMAPDARHIGIIAGVGHKRSNRGLPVPHWVSVLQHVRQLVPGSLVFHLLGGADDAALCEQLMTAMPSDDDTQLVNHAARWSILQTASLLQACDVVLGGDTGPTHLAAAVGVRVISPFGPTDARRTGPVGNARCLTPPSDLPCWPCEKPTCHWPEPLACLNPANWLDELTGLLAARQL